MGIDGAIYNDATGITSKVGTAPPPTGSKVPGIRDSFSGGYNPPPTTNAMANRDYTKFMGGTENAGNATYLDVAKPSSYNPALNTQTTPQVAPVPQGNAPVYGNPAKISEDGLTGLTNRAGNNPISVDSISDNLSQTGQGIKNVFTDYSATRDAMGLTDGEMAMKFGMPMAAGLAGGLEESDFQEKGVDMTEFEDNRFRGPEGQLNLSGKTALNLNNPYGYAEGGAVKQGMEAAIARNIGRTYTPPASVSAPVSRPVSAPVAPSNINVGGFTSSPTNLTGGLGALNVGSGTVGQSPNAVAAEAKRIETLKNTPPKYKLVDSGMYGQKRYVPTNYTGFGSYNDPYGMTQRAGEAEARARAGYAEGGYLGGGDVNVQGDGMSDDIPANIDNEQPAALSEGEFVVPADVVSHIGNGSSEAGAKEFYGMMDRVRMARTGRKKQSPEIDPERFMPA